MSLAARILARKAQGQAFDFDAAANARAEKAARAAEEAAARAVAGGGADEGALLRDPPKKKWGTLAQRQRLRRAAMVGAQVLAQRQQIDETPLTGATAEAGQMRVQLITDLRRLKAIESTEAKIALKAELLPAYADYVAGFLQADTGVEDETVSWVLVWRIDVGDYAGALPIADYMIRHNIGLPGRIDRKTPTFVTEEIAEAALKSYALGGEPASAFPGAVLLDLEDLVDGCDMPDQVKAKLHKAKGRQLLWTAETTDDDPKRRIAQESALKELQRALQLDDGAGVKKDIETLQRVLKKPDTPPA